jgi:protein-S-isoprenylcysteine O-methyltransferase Ste14
MKSRMEKASVGRGGFLLDCAMERGNPLAIKSFTRTLQRKRVPLGFIAAALLVVFSRPTWHLMSIGAPIALCGLAIRAWAAGHLRKKVELATSGPYAHARNPLYLGSCLTAAGCGVSAGNLWLGLALLVCLAAVYVPVIRAEERETRKLYANDYPSYAEAVPPFVPRLTPYRGPVQRSFDWRLYLSRREYQALIGLAVVMGILALKAAKILKLGY